jgi:hypothetical protein
MESSSTRGPLTLKTTNMYGEAQSDNWSGYVTPLDQAKYDNTSTTFTVPAVTCGSETTASAFWAGIDGDNDSTVEQDGIEAGCTGGSPELYGWLEMYPAPESEIVTGSGEPAPVEPGDTIVSTVTEDTPIEYTLYLSDETQGWYVDTEMSMPSGYTGADATSEVIAEAPTECTGSSCSVLPLADFGSVNYSDAIFNGTNDYSVSNADPWVMVQNGVPADAVGALGTAGAFTVEYGSPSVPVPAETGQTRASAISALTAAGFMVDAPAAVNGVTQYVTAESPGAGTSATFGSTVTLTTEHYDAASEIKNVHSGKCMNITNGVYATGGTVNQYTCGAMWDGKAGGAQQFRIAVLSVGTSTPTDILQAVSPSGTAINVAATISSSPLSLTTKTAAMTKTGEYYTFPGTGLVADVKGASDANLASVIGYADHEATNQQWTPAG